MEIKIGMKVWLKTGSPAMSVNSQESSNQWVCQWFDGIKFNKETFHGEQLTDENPVANYGITVISRQGSKNHW